MRGVLEQAGRSGWLFPGRDGKPLRTTSAAVTLFRLNKRMGIEQRFGTHDLRRTCATRLGDMGVPDEIIAQGA